MRMKPGFPDEIPHEERHFELQMPTQTGVHGKTKFASIRVSFILVFSHPSFELVDPCCVIECGLSSAALRPRQAVRDQFGMTPAGLSMDPRDTKSNAAVPFWPELCVKVQESKSIT